VRDVHPPQRASQRQPEQRVVARWELFETVKSWPVVNHEPFASPDHARGCCRARVRVSPASRESYLELVPDSRLEPGTVVASFLHDAATDRLRVVFAMQKDEDGWQYLSVRSDGTLLAAGAVPECVRCHAEAVADSLFGLPRGTR
jgi:hypothetical protein